MSAEQLENKLKEFNVKKKKSGDVLTHKQVISKRYTERIPANTRMKKKAGTKDAPSKTKPGKKDYMGGKGDIKKSAGKDVKAENSQVDFEPSTQPKKKTKGKRKPSKYNLHIKKEMKKGKTFKEAAASWSSSKKK